MRSVIVTSHARRWRLARPPARTIVPAPASAAAEDAPDLIGSGTECHRTANRDGENAAETRVRMPDSATAVAIQCGTRADRGIGTDDGLPTERSDARVEGRRGRRARVPGTHPTLSTARSIRNDLRP